MLIPVAEVELKMEEPQFTPSEMMDWLRKRIPNSMDVVYQELVSGDRSARLLYLRSIADEKDIRKLLILPFYDEDELERYESYVASMAKSAYPISKEEALDAVMRGQVALESDGQLRFIDFQTNVNQHIPEATFESTIQGPVNAFSEDIAVNLNIIRTRYPQPSLRVESHTVGSISKTPVAMVFDEAYVDPDVLQKVRDALARIDTDVIQAAGQLHTQLTKRKWSLFPTMLTTERPDRVAFNLSHGKIAFILQGTPFVLIVPSVFYDFISAMDDFYQSFWVNRAMVLIRYMGLLVSLTLASFYVAVTSYNPELLRVQLALSIAGSRAPVPYPSYIEVLFMLVMMEMLTEASVRLPKSIGSTATTVGGLILGQAATQAGLISNIMIIIVAAVAISNFVIPIAAMSYGMRMVKYLLLLVTTLFGLMGLMAGLTALVSYLASLESFGKPYLKVFMESRKSASATSKGEGGAA